jgi:hypothetical protein
VYENNESSVPVLDKSIPPYRQVSTEVKGLFTAFTGMFRGLEELKFAHNATNVSLLYY